MQSSGGLVGILACVLALGNGAAVSSRIGWFLLMVLGMVSLFPIRLQRISLLLVHRQVSCGGPSVVLVRACTPGGLVFSG